MAVDFKRALVPCAIGLAPPIMVALTWAPDGLPTTTELSLRAFYAAFLGAELLTVLVAIWQGMPSSLGRWAWSRPAAMALLLLLAIAAATVAFAPVWQAALILTLYWFIHAAFALSVAHLCGRLFEPSDLVRAYLAGFALFALQFLLFIALVPDWTSFDWREHFMTFTHVRHAGYYLAAMAGMAIGVMASARSRGEWLAALLLASAASGIAMWTGSRGAMLAVAGTWAAGLLLSPPMRSVRGWGGGLLSLAIALCVVLLAPSVENPLMGLERTVEATAKADVTTGRTDIWAGAWEAIKQRPLFGYGEGQMRAVAPYSTMIQPHNSILQVTLAWGFAGLACILVLLAAFAIRAVPAIRRDTGPLTPPFLAMTAIGILSLYDGALFYPLPTSIFLACGAMILAGGRRVPNEPSA